MTTNPLLSALFAMPSHEEPGISHPALHELGRGRPGRRVQRAVQATAGQRAALRELVEPSQEPSFVDRDKLARLHAFTRCTNQPSPGVAVTFPSK